MKNPKTALFIGIIFLLAIIAYSFVGNIPVKNTSIAQNQAAQEKGQEHKVRNQGAGEQNPTSKDNSFYAGKVFGGEQGDLNDTKAKVNRGKKYLLTQVDNRVGQLGPFRDRIGNMDALNDSDKKSLVSELNAEIDMFGALKAEISRSATKEDVKNVADKIKAEWIKSRLSVERAEGLIVATKGNKLITDADAASVGLQKRLDALKAEGKDTTTQEKLLSAYSKKIADAKQDIESAKEKTSALANASTDGEKEALTKEKDQLMKRSGDNIRDAYKLLADEARKEFSRKLP